MISLKARRCEATQTLTKIHARVRTWHLLLRVLLAFFCTVSPSRGIRHQVIRPTNHFEFARSPLSLQKVRWPLHVSNRIPVRAFLAKIAYFFRESPISIGDATWPAGLEVKIFARRIFRVFLLVIRVLCCFSSTSQPFHLAFFDPTAVVNRKHACCAELAKCKMPELIFDCVDCIFGVCIIQKEQLLFILGSPMPPYVNK